MKSKVIKNSMIGVDDAEHQIGDSVSLAETVTPRFAEFGKLLKTKRQSDMFTLTEAVERSISNKNHLSKSLLSMYENGNMRDIDDCNMTTLSLVYGIPHKTLVEMLCSQKYKIQLTANPIGASSAVDLLSDVTVLSLNDLQERQESLSNNATVVISADDFLDDDIFYGLVSNNINRGIRYAYHIPAHSESDVISFRERLLIDNVLEGNEGKIKENTQYFLQNEDEFSFNFVVHIDNGSHMAFKGIAVGKRPTAYYQVSGTEGKKLLKHIGFSVATSDNPKEVENYGRLALVITNN